MEWVVLAVGKGLEAIDHERLGGGRGRSVPREKEKRVASGPLGMGLEGRRCGLESTTQLPQSCTPIGERVEGGA